MLHVQLIAIGCFDVTKVSITRVRSVVSKRTRKALLALGLGCVVSVAAADSYGVSDSAVNNTAQAASSSASSANQQAVIDELLQRASANSNSNSNSNLSSSAKNGAATSTTQQAKPATQSASNSQKTVRTPDIGVSDEAFANTVRNMLPLSPDQIRTLRKMFDDSQRAVAAAPGTPAKPTSASVMVNLSPGSTPPVIRLQSGFVTSLVFLDSTGAPWPIKAFDLGDPSSYNVQWDKKGNTLMLQALTQYKQGNLAVMLKDMNTPVMLMLMPGQNAVDYRVDLRIPGLGPEANPILNGLPSTASPELLSFLDGVPPQGAKALKISGGECQGWSLNGHVYLRTRLNVISPAWISTMSSPDGTHVYEMQNTPVVLTSARGKLVKLVIKGL